jgi:hypothetical protein
MDAEGEELLTRVEVLGGSSAGAVARSRAGADDAMTKFLDGHSEKVKREREEEPEKKKISKVHLYPHLMDPCRLSYNMTSRENGVFSKSRQSCTISRSFQNVDALICRCHERKVLGPDVAQRKARAFPKVVLSLRSSPLFRVRISTWGPW